MRLGLLSSLLLLLAPALASAQPGTLADCDAQVRRDPSRASLCYPQLVQQQHVRRDDAIRHLTPRLDAHPDDNQTRLTLGLLLATSGDSAAEAHFRGAAAGFAQSGNATGEALASSALANFLMRRGRVPEAVDALAAAERAAQTSGDDVLVARVKTGQAWAAYRQLDYGRATRLLKEVEPTVRAGSDAAVKASWLSCYGANLWALGRTDEALATYEEEVALHRETGNRYDEATALSNVALLTSPPKRFELARETARIAHEAGNIPMEASAYFYLSETGTPEEARAYAQRSLDLSRQVHSADGIGRAQGALAIRTLPMDAPEAFRLIDEAIEEARGFGDPNQVVRHRFVKSNMRWMVGPRDAAIDDSLALLDAVERLRGFQPEADVRAARFAQWRWGYYRLAGHLLAGHLSEPGRPSAADRELAFRTIERMRSRMLLDRLDASGARESGGSNPLRIERERLLRQIAETNRRLAGLSDGPDKTAALQQLEDLESRAQEAAANLARADPSFGLMHTPAIATLDNVRDALRADEALLTYQTASLQSLQSNQGEDYGGWIWLITRSEIRTIPLTNPDRLDPAVDLFNGLIERGDNSEGIAAARLYRILIAPALESLGAPIGKLVIIPDGTLFRLPFDALRETPASPPLGVRLQITLAPSATAWLRWREPRRALAAIPALVLADPALPAISETSGPMRDIGAGLAPLPEARSEGLALVRALGGGSRIFTGAEATEAALKKMALGDYRILHFAAHAVIDDLHPERSAVMLAPGDAAEDGFLQAREIADLRLDGQLVLLSSCRSAGGALVPGEGVLGLAHAFFRAGARSVIGTLWPIRDDHAREAFELIGGHLGQGMTVAAAVTTARATLQRKGVPASAWASLVVMGDGEFVPLPGGRRWQADRFLWGALVCAAAAVFALTARVRRTSVARR